MNLSYFNVQSNENIDCKLKIIIKNEYLFWAHLKFSCLFVSYTYSYLIELYKQIQPEYLKIIKFCLLLYSHFKNLSKF